MSKVKEYFKLYPANTECFETSDGTIFHTKYDANMHAGSLEDKEVIPHAASKNKDADNKADTDKKAAAEKAAAEKGAK